MKLQNISSLPQLARAYIKLAHVLCHISKFAPNRKTPVPKVKGKPPTLHNLQKLNYCLQAVSWSQNYKLRKFKTKSSTTSRAKLATLDAYNTKCRYPQLKPKRRTQNLCLIHGAKLVLVCLLPKMLYFPENQQFALSKIF